MPSISVIILALQVAENTHMRDVVVIGGGLSGLAACYELEKRGIPYTLIEVKDRLGGSIHSRVDKGFVTDGCAFAFAPIEDAALLRSLGLQGASFDFAPGHTGFRAGSGALVDAMSSRLTGGKLLRMAVSSIGRWKGRYTLCLENGMVLDAGAVIVAAPARYAQRMLYNLAPEISSRLRDYQYDSIIRVSLGYHKDDLPNARPRPFSAIFPFVSATDADGRVPDGDHMLLQVGARSQAGIDPDQVLAAVVDHYGGGRDPVMWRVGHWAEADPLSCYDDCHCENMAAIQASLPAGLGLIGSDYCLEPPQRAGIARLDERLRQGQDAARNAIVYLRGKQRR